jgi:uncharacterized membrane protein YedE/YeeE
MRGLIAFAAGLVFGLGLLVSDMANPARVLAFLDVARMAEGTWDPTLMFVMGGAMSVSALAWLVSYRRARAVFGGPLPEPARPRIDARLIAGSAVFGVGWGLAGICPGPGLVALGVGGAPLAVFVAAMAAGMLVFGLANRALTAATAEG